MRWKMTKGTASMGKTNNKTHILSRINGKQSWHKQKHRCGFGDGSSNRTFNWSAKAKRRNTQGTKRMRYLKHVYRRA